MEDAFTVNLMTEIANICGEGDENPLSSRSTENTNASGLDAYDQSMIEFCADSSDGYRKMNYRYRTDTFIENSNYILRV